MEANGHKSKFAKKPWPTKRAMIQVYEKKLWGGNQTDFYSGVGSHHPQIITPYLRDLIAFLSDFENPLTVCDLGCGDFNIGSKLVEYTQFYHAVDIVPELVKRNKKKFDLKNLEFYCLDISNDVLPAADCVLLRQVLQHLSNKEILRIINKLSAFKYVIITEHLPAGEYEPNRDIISGQGIRLKKQSGVKVLSAPFNLKVTEEKLLSAIDLGKGKGVIETTLYQLW